MPETYETVEKERDQYRSKIAELKAALKGLSNENDPAQYGYCFCGVAINDPNYKGIHSDACKQAQEALAE